MVLVVEDTEFDRAMTLKALRQARVHTETRVARDGHEVVRSLGLNAPHGPFPIPDLIFLDLKLPGLDGTALLRLIRERQSLADVPVVVFSDSDHPTDLAACRNLGATSYVRKPLDAEEYIRVVREVTEHWLANMPTRKAHAPHCILTPHLNYVKVGTE